MEKHIIISVQTTPKTQPGGVQDALLRLLYHIPLGPSPIKKLPSASPTKLRIKNNAKSNDIMFLLLNNCDLLHVI